ncbi:heavy metal-associated isoprenylated plant protein 34-like [Andrographis paniculata]|uniref:heavy metal-associated isoprenylated plant protein 34-like n=1 Tax=Andrographis paniculata TaxID=175694 RepID=UPI0021E8A1DF|nr:heavy metal-associated isoprenylated plant protein 34-like [Andrographis paniculata]
MNNKKDMLKIQPWVLRVNIHCDGCAHKVQKQLQKVEGVYKVSIDVEQGKVTVSGNVDPAALIKKLEKAGKHAELWGGQKGGSNAIPMLNHQFKNFQMEKSNGGKGNKGQKGGKGQQQQQQQQKGGFQVPKEMMQLKNNEFKEMKFLGKDKKSVKFNLPEDEEEDYDDDDDYFDDSEEDDSFEDGFDEGYAAHQLPAKVAPLAGHGGKANKVNLDLSHQKGKNGGKNGGGKGEKDGKGEKIKAEKAKSGSGRFDTFLKSMLGKGGGGGGGAKTDAEGKHSKKKDKKQKGDSKKSKKGIDFELDQGKNGAKNSKGNDKGMIHGNGGKMNENFEGFPRMETRQPPSFNNMNTGMNMMGQMPPNFQAAAQGLSRMGPMNGGHYPGGFGQGNHHHHAQAPYNNPQYMDQMRMMMYQQQQQQQQQYGGYNHNNNMGYMSMPTAAPPPGGDHYTHMFSDENTGSCSVM